MQLYDELWLGRDLASPQLPCSLPLSLVDPAVRLTVGTRYKDSSLRLCSRRAQTFCVSLRLRYVFCIDPCMCLSCSVTHSLSDVIEHYYRLRVPGGPRRQAR